MCNHVLSCRMDNNNMPDTNRFGFLVFKLHLESYCSAFSLPAAVASLTTTTNSPCSISSTGSAAVTAPASCVAAAAATGAVQQWRLVESDHTELNVSRSSDVNKMANAVLGVVQSRASSGGQGVMKVGGSDALFKAMSAVINARKRLQVRGAAAAADMVVMWAGWWAVGSTRDERAEGATGMWVGMVMGLNGWCGCLLWCIGRCTSIMQSVRLHACMHMNGQHLWNSLLPPTHIHAGALWPRPHARAVLHHRGHQQHIGQGEQVPALQHCALRA